MVRNTVSRTWAEAMKSEVQQLFVANDKHRLDLSHAVGRYRELVFSLTVRRNRETPLKLAPFVGADHAGVNLIEYTEMPA